MVDTSDLVVYSPHCALVIGYLRSGSPHPIYSSIHTGYKYKVQSTECRETEKHRNNNATNRNHNRNRVTITTPSNPEPSNLLSRLTEEICRAGVIGLTTALAIQPRLKPSQSVLLVARDFPNTTSLNYASPWAGAHYRPVPGTTPQALRENRQARRTHAHFKTIAAAQPAAGIAEVEGMEILENPPGEYLDTRAVGDAYRGHLDEFRELVPSTDDSSTSALPHGVKWGVRYKTFVVNSPVYCAYLLRRFVLNGGHIREYTLVDLMEAFHLAENVRAVVNCSGLGLGDFRSFIIRGAHPYCLTLIPKFRSMIATNQQSRPNLPRSQPLPHNPHQTTLRRHLFLLHPAPAGRWHDYRRHQGTTQLGPEPIARDSCAPSRQSSGVVSLRV